MPHNATELLFLGLSMSEGCSREAQEGTHWETRRTSSSEHTRSKGGDTDQITDGDWRGLAIVIVKECHERFFVSWRELLSFVGCSNYARSHNGGERVSWHEELRTFEERW
ncbi:unnamed protein product [Durusdinium trenchii]|uniref:Uncharacterized protein n=1 Tax=Durusdinium trenchii TaxID=1381693 RepID=A0ABP0L3D7_9DINO